MCAGRMGELVGAGRLSFFSELFLAMKYEGLYKARRGGSQAN